MESERSDLSLQTQKYGFGVHVDGEPDEVEPRVRELLAAEGFGVLTEIDVQATLKAKLGEDVPPYRILGACNPPLAHRAMAADPDIGALLPCNVVVRAGRAGGTDVVVADPEAMLALSDSPALNAIACDAKERLERVVAGLAAP